MRCITTTVLCTVCTLFFLLGSTGFTSLNHDNQVSSSDREPFDAEAIVSQLDEFTFEFQLANKISKEDKAFYEKRLNHGVKFAQSIVLTRKSCKIAFKSDSTEDEMLQGITFATRTFRFKTFKITTHE